MVGGCHHHRVPFDWTEDPHDRVPRDEDTVVVISSDDTESRSPDSSSGDVDRGSPLLERRRPSVADAVSGDDPRRCRVDLKPLGGGNSEPRASMKRSRDSPTMSHGGSTEPRSSKKRSGDNQVRLTKHFTASSVKGDGNAGFGLGEEPSIPYSGMGIASDNLQATLSEATAGVKLEGHKEMLSRTPIQSRVNQIDASTTGLQLRKLLASIKNSQSWVGTSSSSHARNKTASEG